MTYEKGDFEKYLESHDHSRRLYSRLNKVGRKYLEDLLSYCPANSEYEFNCWVLGGMGSQFRINRKDQMNIVDEIYIMFLNQIVKK